MNNSGINYFKKGSVMNKILVIEDDKKIQTYIKDYLSAYDYNICIITDFSNILEEISTIQPNLIILDINLPYFDGFYFLKIIRKSYSMPIIILSARSDEGEQIRGMSQGADDYITKPFSMGILLAKINAIMRRTNNYNSQILCDGNLELIEDSMRINYLESTIDLSKNEYIILKKFLSNKNKIITREELLELIWDDTVFVDDNTLNVNITRVKQKLKLLNIENVITTKRGVGYVYTGIN